MENYLDESVRERLLLSALRELEEHGFRDFSLRRVASSAQVSCAAPYRHFKSKDELILAVIRHVRDGWYLLCEQIGSVYKSDSAAQLVELCTSGVRFWLANASFRSVLFGGISGSDRERRKELRLFDKPIQDCIESLSLSFGLDAAKTERLSYSALAVFWGTVMLAASSDGAAIELCIKNMRSELYSLLDF